MRIAMEYYGDETLFAGCDSDIIYLLPPDVKLTVGQKEVLEKAGWLFSEMDGWYKLV